MSVEKPRQLALAQGDRYYLSDKPCKRGHVGKRLTLCGNCIECKQLLERDRYRKNAEKYRDKARKYAEKNRAILAKKARLARANESPEKRAARLEKAKIKQREWRKRNPNHEGAKLSKRRYKRSEKGLIADSRSRIVRRGALKQAVPVWADLVEIANVYIEASYMQMQVDHIVPLRNHLVCGLHVWDNLQLLDPITNNKKGNRYWPDMP